MFWQGFEVILDKFSKEIDFILIALSVGFMILDM